MSRALILVALSCLVGCRLGFDDYYGRDAGGDAAPGDGAVTQVVIGERTLVTAQNTFDTTLDQFMPNLASGNLEDVAMTGSVGAIEWTLLRFDLTTLAPGTTIVAARLEIERTAAPDELPGEIAVSPMTEAWDEATATWNQRATGMSWATFGGTRGPEMMRQTPPTTAFAMTLTPSVAQIWVDTPAMNFGVAVGAVDTVNDTHYHFHSRESLVPASRPQLVLDVIE